MLKKKNLKYDNLLIAVIGDEVTVTGLLLAGIGERKEDQKNFFIINKEQDFEIEEIFKSLTKRKDIGIILISQNIADMIRGTINKYNEIIPTVLEIPSKSSPYSLEKDSIIAKASRHVYGTSIPPEDIELDKDDDEIL